MSEWTHEDSCYAIGQGWEIFSTSRDPAEALFTSDGTPYGYRPFELQKLDDADAFSTDQEAWAHVVSRAAAGDALSQKALAFLAENSPDEYNAILEATKEIA